MKPASAKRPHASITIGLMSGTSLDGIDGVLVAHSPSAPPHVLGAHHLNMPPQLRQRFETLNHPGHNELHLSALAASELAQCYAKVVTQLLSDSALTASDIRAIGAHGQTVRHQPLTLDPLRRHALHCASVDAPWTAYTIQLNNPALLAELTGITVVADFRSRDVAAGGQGAPLVPAFHAAVFGNPKGTAIVNIGGMANVTLLQPDQAIQGFDTGPGNVLMDAWCQLYQSKAYDANGAWAASGTVNPQLLASLLSDPYFALHGPRSTGREWFNLAWLHGHLNQQAPIPPEDVQATLLELTVMSIARALPSSLHHVVVCGGGALNGTLMRRLAEINTDGAVTTSKQWGIPVMDVEAAAFAWLAEQCLNGLPGNLVEVTGAAGPRVLGAVYPA